MNGKRILVTGGAGFVGSNLIKRLVAEGNIVISLDNYFAGTAEPVAGAIYRTGHTKDVAAHIPEDIDVIFHLGEYSRVEKSVDEPEIVWDLNVHGTFGVVSFWKSQNRDGKSCKLIYAGSSTKFSDGGATRHTSPYAWTKATNTELVKNYATWFGLPYAITYFYNVYGPGERAGSMGTLIEIFRTKKLNGEKLGVVTPGTQSRNFTHVDDIVEGLMLVGEKGEGDEFGLGNDTSYTVLEVAQMFGSEIEMLPERKGNRASGELHTEKSKALGWKPTRSLREYIEAIA